MATPETPLIERPFPLKDLPAELREWVYFHTMAPFPPINTAAIANTQNMDVPTMAPIPAIAQVDRAIRAEALAVFYRNRELRISLHCGRNILRATAWLNSVGRSRVLPNRITIEGMGRYLDAGDTFSITIHCSEQLPQFRVDARPGASVQTQEVVELMKKEVTEYLEERAKAKEGWKEQGKLKACELSSIVNRVRKIAGCA